MNASGRHGDISSMLPSQVETGLRKTVEAELHETLHQKDALAQKVADLTEETQQQAATIASHKADIEELRGDLQHSCGQERQLAEEKAKLEVNGKGHWSRLAAALGEGPM